MSQAAFAAQSAAISGDSSVSYGAGPPPWVWLAALAVAAFLTWHWFKRK